MRPALAALVLAALGCGNPSSNESKPPRKDTGPLAELHALVDEACACKDVACRRAVKARWSAAVDGRSEPPDPTTMSQQEIQAELVDTAAFVDLRTRMFTCIERDRSPAAMTRRLAAYADRACACPQGDSGCIAAARAEQTEYLENTWTGSRFDPAEQEAVSAEMRRFQDCAASR